MKTYIIAEVAQAHDGSIGILHSYIDAVASTGVDAIKFQTHIAEAESSEYEKFRINFSYEDKTRYQYWKRMELTIKQWSEVKRHCENVGIDFLSTPFSCAAVDVLEDLGVGCYKVGSGDVNNLLLLDKVCKTNKDIILSSGMSSLDELDRAVRTVKDSGNNISVMQCTTEYPVPPERMGLNLIKELKERYNVPTGLSDHTGIIYSGVAAAALGAEIYESHVVFDKRMFGPDSKSSLDIGELRCVVDGIRFIEKAITNPVSKDGGDRYDNLKEIFGRSLAVNKDISEGHVISENDLESKKPYGKGIAASEYRSVIGRAVNKDKKKYEFLLESDC